MTSRAVVVVTLRCCAVAFALAAAVLSASGCGVLDGIFGGAAVPPQADACASDVDCGGGDLCSDLNDRFCAEGPLEGGGSCDEELGRAAQCKTPCEDSQGCSVGFTCVEVGVTEAVRERACEEVRCAASDECGAGFVCAQPLSMQIDVDGFCLPSCDPLSCAGGLSDGCACNDVASQCAPVFEGDEANKVIVGYACTVAGDIKIAGACEEQGDCNAGTLCFDGSCAPYCDLAAPVCASGAPCVAIGPAGGNEGACRESCDEDTVCERNELESCVDCEALECDRDGSCDDSEGQRCGDCVLRCDDDEDCADSETCSSLNAALCNEEEQVNCDVNQPTASVCRLRCTSSSECDGLGDGFVCADTNLSAEVALQACEPGRCSGATICGGGEPCVDPSLLVLVVSAFDAGLCLTPCDPTPCATAGEPCSCGPSDDRCAPVRDATDAIAGYVCTFAGQGQEGDACTNEASCGTGQACFGNFCRAYCDDTALCDGVCEVLDAATEPPVLVCVPS